MRPPLTLALFATPQAVAGVRSALRGYMGGPCADLQLCASELLANVVRHLGEGVLVTVRVGCDQGFTRLEVTDPDPRALPVLCESATAADESGRGLALLADAAVGRGPGAEHQDRVVRGGVTSPGGRAGQHRDGPAGRSRSPTGDITADPRDGRRLRLVGPVRRYDR